MQIERIREYEGNLLSRPETFCMSSCPYMVKHRSHFLQKSELCSPRLMAETRSRYAIAENSPDGIQSGSWGRREVFSSIREAYEFAWRRATSHLNQAERQTFPDHPLFITGGGSLVPGIAEFLCNDPGRVNFRRKVRSLERQNDLYTLDDRPIPNDARRADRWRSRGIRCLPQVLH